jgi:hypothetical protein
VLTTRQCDVRFLVAGKILRPSIRKLLLYSSPLRKTIFEISSVAQLFKNSQHFTETKI